MNRFLVLSVRFLDGRYHGVTNNGERPEWPPSPFRLFQALVAGNARTSSLPEPVRSALGWLETLPPPDIIAPVAQPSRVTITYVPNNVMHRNRRSRTPKFIRPMALNRERVVQYAWSFDDSGPGASKHAAVVVEATKHIRCLGWGIDLAIGHGDILDNQPMATTERVRYRPSTTVASGVTELRIPIRGSLISLVRAYTDTMNRYKSVGITVLESAAAIYEPWRYITDLSRPVAIFKLIDDNEDTYRYPHAKLIHISAMVRHLAIERMRHDPPPWIENPAEWVNRVVRGKRNPSSNGKHRQFSYIPLPSIGHEHADAMIRNVMVIAPLGMDRELKHLAERLGGELLQPEGEFDACEAHSKPVIAQRIELRRFTPPAGKFIDSCYLGTWCKWHTVTPVILDGHDDRKPEKTAKLIQIALRRAGVETPCKFTWQANRFLKNCLSAHKYDHAGRHTGYHRPAHLKDLTAVHVRLTFTNPVSGPLAIGAGRHCGFGLMAGFDGLEG